MDTKKDTLDTSKDIQKSFDGGSQNYPSALFRSERLASAIYLVTDFISDIDPIKWTLRKGALNLVSDISSLRTREPYSEQDELVGRILNRIAEVTSYLEVAWVGRMISDMNFKIIRAEYLSIQNFLRDAFYSGGSTTGTFSLSHEFFSEGKLFDKGQKNIKSVLYENSLGNVRLNSGTQSLPRPQIQKIGVTDSAIVPPTRIKLVVAPENKQKVDRQGKILNLLKTGGQHSVKDIISAIGLSENLSEKTIQRDLSFMASNGTIKKTGKKRWSRYFM